MRSRRPHHGVVSHRAPTNPANLNQRTIEFRTEVAAKAHDRREQTHHREQDQIDVGPYQEPLVRRQNQDESRTQRQLWKGLAQLVRKGNQIRRTRRVGHDVEDQESPHPADPPTDRPLVRTGQETPITGELRGERGDRRILLRDVPRQAGHAGMTPSATGTPTNGASGCRRPTDSSCSSAPIRTPDRMVIPAARSRTAVELTAWALERPAVTETTACFAQLRCQAPLEGSTLVNTRTVFAPSVCGHPWWLNDLVHVVLEEA